jgi:POT family proton-dependent oligopeptide transporter
MKVAEQYTNTRRYVKVLKTGERVLVDPVITIQRLFMLFYWMINLGSLSSIATTELEHHVGFWAAFLLPLIVFCFGIFALIYGKKYYYSRRPRGSVVLNSIRALWIGVRAGFNLEAAKPSYCDLHSCKYSPQWSDLFVDEIRRALVACRIFVFFPIVRILLNQINCSIGCVMVKWSTMILWKSCLTKAIRLQS